MHIISLSPEKLQYIYVTSSHPLQSLFGNLLYIHKCVKPARIFLNHMLDFLRKKMSQRDQGFLRRDQGFLCRDQGFLHRDQGFLRRDQGFLRRDQGFLRFSTNGASYFVHRQVDDVLELDAGLPGLWVGGGT